MSLCELTDEELVSRARSANGGDRKELLNELFGRYHQRVARWCFRVTGDRESAADLAQEVFLRVQQRLESFEGSARFSTWLFAVTRNHTLNAVRGQARGSEVYDPDVPNLPDLGCSPYQIAERESIYRRMRDMLRTVLDDTERKVFVLHYGEDVPLDAITRLLNLRNASGAKGHIVSAKRKLGRALKRIQSL